MDKRLAAVLGYAMLAWQTQGSTEAEERMSETDFLLIRAEAVAPARSLSRDYGQWHRSVASRAGARAIIVVGLPVATAEHWRKQADRWGWDFWFWRSRADADSNTNGQWRGGVHEVYTDDTGKLRFVGSGPYLQPTFQAPVYREPIRPAIRYLPPVQSVSPSNPRHEEVILAPTYSAPAVYSQPSYTTYTQPVYSTPRVCGPGGCCQ